MEVERDFEEIFRMLAPIQRAVDAREPMAAGHSERVVRYAEIIAKALGFDDERIKWLKLAALLQDIGKLGIPESILSKPGLLSADEVEIIKKHVQLSAQIVKRMKLFDRIVPWILAHHERWDGKGYPQGLQGEEIPIEARILSLADSLEAMTAPRVYRRALKWDEVKQILKQGAGKQWDPHIVDIALKVIHHPPTLPELEYLDFKEVHVLRMESARAQKRLSLLYEVTHIVRSSLSVEEAFARTFISLYEQMGYNYLAAFTVQNGEKLRLFAALGFPKNSSLEIDLDSNGMSKKLILAVKEHVPEFQKATTIWIRTDTDVVGAVLVGEDSFYSLGVVPLRNGTETIGAFLVGEETDEVFSPEDFKFFESVASHLQIPLKRMSNLQDEPLFIDPTTGFYYLSSLSQRLKRRDKLTLSYIQIPEFQNVKQLYGDYIAEMLKRQFAHELRRSVPEIEYWASLGESEFIAVSSRPAEILRFDLQRLKHELRDKAVKIKFEIYVLPSFKFGIASAPDDGAELEKLLETAKLRAK